MHRFLAVKRSALGLLAILGGTLCAPAQFLYPVSGPLTSVYNSPRSYGIHGAIDIAAASWTPIRAAYAGTVSFAAVNGGYGNLVILDHTSGYQTYYAHQVNISISVGRAVNAGDVIGYVGSTGNSTGPHLHLEIRRYGAQQYIPGNVGDNVTQGTQIPYTYPGLGGGGGGAKKVIQVNTSALNVRSGPSTSYSILGLAYSGQRYVRFQTSGGWHQIWFDGRAAWVSGTYTVDKSGAVAHQVNTSALNVRTGPSTSYSIVGTAHSGEYYAESTLSGTWAQIWFGGALRWFSATYTVRVTL